MQKNLINIFNKNVFVLSRNPQNKFRDQFLNASEKVKKIAKSELKDFDEFEILIFATPSSIRYLSLENADKLKIKNIYTEVPAAISFSHWENLKLYSSNLNAKLYAGYNMRFHPGLIKLKSLSNKNFLSLRGVFGEYLPDLHKWEDYKKRYEAINILGGGPLLTSHHEIDIAILLMGKVEKVSCIMRNTHLDIDSYDHAIVNLFHENNSISNLDLNFFYKEYVRGIEIANSNEIIKYHPFHDGLKIGKEEAISFKDFDFNQTYIDSLSSVFSANYDKLPSLENIDHLMKVSDACLKSSNNDGRLIKV